MGKVKWGVIAAAIATVAVAVVAIRGVFTNGDEPTEPASSTTTASISESDGQAEAEPAGDAPAQIEREESGTDETAQQETAERETRPDEAEQRETGQQENQAKETAQGETEPAETEPGETEPAETEQGETEQGETEQGETEQGETEQGEAEQGETTQGETTQGETTQGETTQGETTQGEAAQQGAQPEETELQEADASQQASAGESNGDEAAEDDGAIERVAGTTGETDDGAAAGSGTSSGTGISPESDGVSGDAGNGGSRPAGDGDDADAALQEEAESFVRDLAEPGDEPVPVERAEGFVGGDQPLAATEAGQADGQEDTDGGEALPESTPANAAAPEEEAVDAGPETAARPQPAAADATDAAPPGSTASEDEPAPDTGTPVAAAEEAPAPDGTGQAAVRSDVDLPLSEQAPITIAELLEAEETIPSDAVFYVHTVQPDDNQGIWGIVHDGILKNFAEGVAVHRGESTETYQVDIPRNADERRPDSSSSFLGKLIYEKSKDTYVYNYRADRLGQNPDLIIPGQEIVIVSFTPEELIAIYKHFVSSRES